MTRRLTCLFVLLALPALARAQAAPDKAPPEKPSKPEPPKETVSETSGDVFIDGKKVEYRATAGTLPIKDDDGKTTANIFYVAYTKTNEPAKGRPITFCFNGGPGSSSVWLHLGALGPRRVQLTDEGEAPKPPAKLVQNEFSILDLTDLVFIDPVSTGYSRPVEPKDAKQFHGYQEDLQSVGEFIRLYATRNERWDSPKYLAGESYGTTRAAALAGHLQDRVGMRVNGIVLLSAVLNFQTLAPGEGNDLPYALYLPTYAATAWYHKNGGKTSTDDLHKLLDESQRFAEGDYTLALMKGSRLGDDDRKAVAQKMARLTGLSEEYVLRANLRVDPGRFRSELLRDKGKTVGRYDSRLLGTDLDAVGERPEYDPSYSAVQGPFTEALNEYVRDNLKYKSDLPYEILSGRVQPWNFGQAANNRYLNVAPVLRRAMTENRSLRVFVANGYYDLATPYFATRYTFDHLGDKALAGRVTMAYYDAGHMMYINKPSLARLKEDVAKFMGK
jgi:carboxypeptidase C (cathepsin A)